MVVEVVAADRIESDRRTRWAICAAHFGCAHRSGTNSRNANVFLRVGKRVQINCVTSDANSQISTPIHARVTTAMAPIVIQRTIVPTARLKAPADEIGGV
jgi:hypothetical protein